jgi:hypothetical protein
MGPSRRCLLFSQTLQNKECVPLSQFPLVLNMGIMSTMRIFRHQVRRIRRFWARVVSGKENLEIAQVITLAKLNEKGVLKMWSGHIQMFRRLNLRKAILEVRYLPILERRWLTLSPACHHESFMLELSGAWETPHSSSSSPNGDRKETQFCFPYRNFE